MNALASCKPPSSPGGMKSSEIIALGVSILSDLVYTEDLNFLYSQLINHPLFVINKEKLSEFRSVFCAVIDRQNTYIDFIDAMDLLTGFFNDGHTNFELPYTLLSRCLNISCFWKGNKLFLSEDFENIEAGTQIQTIENADVDTLIKLMSKKIPHENIYLVKSRMINYPYENYHIFSQMNLERLFGRKDTYEIAFSINGKTYKKCFYLQDYNGFLNFKDENDFIWYEVLEDTVILHLDMCICNERYKSTLSYLVDLCDKQKIKLLILDLSKNMGGDSSVIEEFIRHVNVDKFNRYEMIGYARGEAQYITQRKDIVVNRKKKIVLI